MTTSSEDAYQALEDAIAQLTECFDTNGYVSVNAVLVVGVQSIDDEGDCVGGVSIYPRHGSQPVYITTGLLETAKTLVLQNQQCDHDEDD